MSTNPQKHPSASSTNNWLSNILRPRAASISVATCLNLSNADPAVALDARPVLPLLSSTQPLSTRLKHLKVFSELCETYHFTHLENILFTVQDILEPIMARDSRHRVFEFMLACIHGQYDNLGMARVTFYNTIRNYGNWDDFYDMYRVLYALCKGGRDISGLEKNIGKLLISWLDVTLQQLPHYPHRLLLTSPRTTHHHTTQATDHISSATGLTGRLTTSESTKTTSTTTMTMTMTDKATKTKTKAAPAPIPYLSDILHLLTVIAKFNFDLFDEEQVTHMVAATQQAFYSSNHADDITTCLTFCDVVVKYRFVPFGALKPFLKIICATVTIPSDILPSSSSFSCWSIFLNLLQSNCAHNAIMTLFDFLDTPLEPGSSAENLAQGAMALLTEAAWGGTDSQLSGDTDVYNISDTTLLLYLFRAVQQGGTNNGVIHACVLKSLTTLVASSEKRQIQWMDWDVVWDIVDLCTQFVLGMMDDSQCKQVLQDQLPDQQSGGSDSGNGDGDDLTYNAVHQLGRFLGRIYNIYLSKNYNGPVGRFIQVLYALRRYASEYSATILLDYYEMEHYFLPLSENWINLLLEITNIFFMSPPTKTTTTIRMRVLDIVEGVCLAVKGVYSELMYQQIVTPMMKYMDQEKDQLIQQKSVGLLVECLLDCQDEPTFDLMLGILKDCSQCRCSTTEQNINTTSATGDGRNNSNSPFTATLSTASRKYNILHHSSSSLVRRKHPETKTKSIPPTQDHATSRNAMTMATFGSISSTSDPLIHGQCVGVSGACGLTDLFEQLLLGNKKDNCIKLYNIITQIANESSGLFCPFGGPKLIAVDLLLRLRCSPNHRIYVIEKVPVTEENDYVLAIRKSYDLRKEKNQAQRENGPFGSTITQPTASKERYGQPSPSILSYKKQQGPRKNENDDDIQDGDGADAGSDNGNQSTGMDGVHGDGNLDAVLNISDMVKGYLTVLSDSPNYEMVVFVARRLPWQLATKHMFCGARESLRDLRRVLVKWISTRNFMKQVTHIPSTVKRNDLTIYAYQLLTSLILYRQLFKKHAQDEMVYAFYIGITQVTVATKHCIHALTLCCHDLPVSITKMINEILQSMSVVISVDSVSVDILEFLSGLARLPNLYSNFTGDMYKPVFAIALNYLQHARSATASGRTGYNTIGSQISPVSTPGMNNSPLINSPNTPGSNVSKPSQNQQGAIPQYAFIMAYMVITVWFTVIPLHERRKHASFIIQRLLAGNSADEQTYTCIDMLSRFTFADIDLFPNKSLVSNILMNGPDESVVVGKAGQGKSTNNKSSRTWVYGQTLLTLKTAKALGWVEMTIRRPSGTVSMMCNIENYIKSDNIDYKTLPALLMMQYQPDLMAPHEVDGMDVCQEDSPTDAMAMEKDDNNTHNQLVTEGEALGITFDGEEEDKTTETIAANLSPSLNDYNKDTNIMSSPTSPVSATSSTNLRFDGPTSAAHKLPPRTPHQMSTTVSSPSSSSSLLSPRMKPSHIDKTKMAKAQEERIQTIVRDILSDRQGEQGVSQQSRSIIRKMEPSLDPGFMYIQVNNYPDMTGSMEMLPPLPDDEATLRAIGDLDRIPVVDFYKIGVLYVGKGQSEEVEILANTRGSPEYVKFLNGLGTIERLRGRVGNTGGLDREMDIDGAYAYFWKDNVTEMVFHVATMMPTRLDRDPHCSGKKRHIDNDSVTIVYFDDDDVTSEYAFDSVPGQSNLINIVVTPYSISTETVSPSQAAWGQENTFFKVTMQQRPDMPDMGPITETKFISAQSLPGFIRLVSLHANIFAQIFHQFGPEGNQEYISHWRERLRHIKRIKDRIQQQQHQSLSSSSNAATTSSNTAGSSTPNTWVTGPFRGVHAATPNVSNTSNIMPTHSSNTLTMPPMSTTPTLASRNSSKQHMENLFDFTRYT